MYFVIIREDWHANKEGFIALSLEDMKVALKEHLDNWGVEYTEEQLQKTIDDKHGLFDQDHKRYVEVEISEVSPGERIDL